MKQELEEKMELWDDKVLRWVPRLTQTRYILIIIAAQGEKGGMSTGNIVRFLYIKR